MRPLRERLEVIDRLARFDLDDGLEPLAPLERQQDEVRIHRGRAGRNRGVLLGARIDAGVETALAPQLEKPDDSIVFKLFPDGPDQDGAH